MPMASKPGAPRPPGTEKAPTRRCLGPITPDSFEALKKAGSLSPGDILVIEAGFRKLKTRARDRTEKILAEARCDFKAAGENCEDCERNIPTGDPIYFFKTGTESGDGVYVCQSCARNWANPEKE